MEDLRGGNGSLWDVGDRKQLKLQGLRGFLESFPGAQADIFQMSCFVCENVPNPKIFILKRKDQPSLTPKKLETTYFGFTKLMPGEVLHEVHSWQAL